MSTSIDVVGVTDLRYIRSQNKLLDDCTEHGPKCQLEVKMKSVFMIVVLIVASATFAHAQYQHGWKNYERPQPGYTYGGRELNPYGRGGSKSYAPGGGRSYGQGGGMSYGLGGGNSYGLGGGKSSLNPWTPIR